MSRSVLTWVIGPKSLVRSALDMKYHNTEHTEKINLHIYSSKTVMSKYIVIHIVI